MNVGLRYSAGKQIQVYIGKEFNNMDHSSVLYNIQKMEQLLKTDSNLNSKRDA